MSYVEHHRVDSTHLPATSVFTNVCEARILRASSAQTSLPTRLPTGSELRLETRLIPAVMLPKAANP